MPSDEFYIGHEAAAPARIAKNVRVAVLVLIAVAAILAVLIAVSQRGFEAGESEYGTKRTFEGVISLRPYPRLLVSRPGASTSYSRYSLVAPGKRGAQDLVRDFDGRLVQLNGTLIYRDGVTMVEVEPDSIFVLPSSERPSGTPEWISAVTLVGEIVDSKCYLGAMNPGHTKVHRDCAARCISGGVPPMFVATDSEGKTSMYWLVMESGRPIGKEILDKIAEPIEITGEIRKEGDQLFLRADPSTYKRRGM
jgi:hypothetical protein